MSPPAGAMRLHGVSISNPGKALWPATAKQPAVTKADLARYLEAVSAWMLPHLRGRPCSIVRAPDGVDGARFFQRHPMKGAPASIARVAIEGEAEPFVQFESVAALVAGAQIAVLEFHPWNCEPGKPEVPGRLVFDLDPAPDAPFADVIAAARELRERLASVGLESLCKTTGGKGLHVVVPLRPARTRAPTWALAKAFALEICRQMAADSPARYLVNMSKQKRAGKIFLDYLRNDRMATAIAPLSPRARHGAPVSMPLAWTQLRAGLDPARYTIGAVPALLARGYAWEDYRRLERPLVAAARKLIGARARA